MEIEKYKIQLDLDRNRIRTILGEAYSVCKDTLETEFDISCDEFVSKIDPFLESNRVSTRVRLNLPSYKYPELFIEVDIRKKKLIARMAQDRMRIHLNRFLTKL
jgi:hypothetical protein